MTPEGKGFSGLISLATDLTLDRQSPTPNAKPAPRKKSDNSSASTVDEAAKRGVEAARKRQATASSNTNRHPPKSSRGANNGSGKWPLRFLAVVCLLMLFGIYQSKNRPASKHVGNSPSTFPSQPETASNDVTVRPASRRSTMYVTAEALNVRSSHSAKAEKLGQLKKYQTVTVFDDESQGKWAAIRYRGEKAFIYSQYLKDGSGEVAYRADCRSKGLARPANGETFDSKLYGEHALKVENQFGPDALIKLKGQDGETVVKAYVRGRQTVTINGIPSGSFQFQYATGKNYSPVCGVFLDDMEASKAPGFEDYKKSYSANGYYTTIMSYTLYRVAGGNLRTQGMPSNQF